MRGVRRTIEGTTLIEASQLVFVYAIYCVVAVVPTVLIFAAARRTIRPRNYLPTGKLTVGALVLSWVLGLVLGVEFSGGIFAHVVYLAIVTPLVALAIVALWFVFTRLIARKRPKPSASPSAD